MKVNNWSLEQVSAGLTSGQIILIDVREPHEFALGHIPGSVPMPLSRFDPHALPDAAGRRIVFSCAAGVRSLRAIELAQAAGLPVDTHYVGGFREWSGAGQDVARD